MGTCPSYFYYTIKEENENCHKNYCSHTYTGNPDKGPCGCRGCRFKASSFYLKLVGLFSLEHLLNFAQLLVDMLLPFFLQMEKYFPRTFGYISNISITIAQSRNMQDHIFSWCKLMTIHFFQSQLCATTLFFASCGSKTIWKTTTLEMFICLADLILSSFVYILNILDQIYD